ncbi:AMP-binding protein [Streptomyces sp. I05A-00742]|uniref:AMP-binding protein n=1 Tax=Streptomyces sp. I05A-00742 TaxID=2732853 RepID=UPI001488C306|nr:AMP-binding protein [Streptomyces sp. I05A-00742]
MHTRNAVPAEAADREEAATGHPRPEDVFGAATVPEVLERAARGGPGFLLIDKDLTETPLPGAVLAATARRVAAALALRGVGHGDRVAIMSSTSSAFLCTLFGVWRAGAVPVIVPLPHRLADLTDLMAETERRLDHVGARCLVVSDAFHGFVGRRLGGGNRSERPLIPCSELVSHQGPPPAPAQCAPDDVAYLQFTSGTTGTPKAVTLTHRQIMANAAVAWRTLGLDDGPAVVVHWLPLYHDMGLISTLGALAGGARLVLQPPEEFLARPDSWVDALSRYGATHTVAPNFAYGLAARSMTQRPRPLDLSALRMCGDGAEPIRLPNLDAFVEAGAVHGLRARAITPMYGLAEATLAVAISPYDRPMARDRVSGTRLAAERVAEPVPAGAPDARELAVCGPPVPGVRIRITGDDGTELGPRRVGEVCLRGPSVMRGYWKAQGATAEVIRDGWLHTGDLGYLTEDGLVVCGRIKDVIIAGGRNLYPEEYEHLSCEVDGVGQVCAAFGLPDTERVVVVAEIGRSGDDAAGLAGQVMTRLRERLGHAPDRVVIVPRQAIPRTSSGKTRRSRCRQLFFAGELPELASVGR